MYQYKIWPASDGRWRTYLPDETKENKRRPIAKKSKRKLEDEIIAFYTAEEDNQYISLVDPTLSYIYPEWIVYRNTLTKSSSTIKRYKSVWNTWFKEKEISTTHITDLNYLYLNKWANSIVKDNGQDRKAYYLIASVIKQIFDYAIENQQYGNHNV